MKIIINLHNMEEPTKYFIYYSGDNTYTISINTDLTENFMSLLNEKDIIQEINETIQVLDNNMYIEKLEYLKNNLDNLFDKIDQIIFNYDDSSINKYIENNPELKAKKLLIYKDLDFSISSLEELKEKFKDNIDNVYFKLSKNYDSINYNEYYKTLKIIDDIVKEIKKYNFSPLESIFYVYDLVRDRQYKLESLDEDFTISRDLTKTLLGDKIVCEGFSRLCSTILNKLDIDCLEIELDNPNSMYNHSRNQIFLKDDKYNIKGVYYLDATFGCKKDKTNNHFLSYKWFLKTRREIEELDSKKYIYTNIPIFDIDLAFKLHNEFNKSGFKNISKDTFKSINNMSNIIMNKTLIQPLNYVSLSPLYEKIDIDSVCEELIQILDYFDRPISGKTFIKALYNVRKNQYYKNPKKYPFSLDDIYYTIIYSKWNIDTAEEKLLKAILGEDVQTDSIKNFLRIISEENLSEKIEKVKLTKTLRLALEKQIKNS